MSKLQVFKASAGSGKTFRLVAEYIKIVVTNPNSYKNVLAVTFTNKATAEMKSRILEELYKLANGEETPIKEILIKETKVSEAIIQERAKVALANILHNYSLFSISTIDSFIQRIIQALLWELGLKGSFELELDNIAVLERAADVMIDQASENKPLFKWLIEMGEASIETGQPWDIRKSLINLGKELFSESFKLLNSDEISSVTNKQDIEIFKRDLKEIVESYKNKLRSKGESAIELINSAGLEERNFAYLSRGVYGFFSKCAKFNVEDNFLDWSNSYVRKAMDDPSGSSWLSGDSKKEKEISLRLTTLVEDKLHGILNELVQLIENESVEFVSAKTVLKNLDSLGILGDLWLTVRKFSEEEGFMLLSDCAPLLREFVKDTDTPFLYEKIGNKYKHMMIDEFQDTSVIQWQNFKPLVENSLSQNGFGMLVGDIKQSIYRWRNGDWRILSTEINNDFRTLGIQQNELLDNRRSLENIVTFNNHFFEGAASVMHNYLSGQLAETDKLVADKILLQFNEAYKSLVQNVSRKGKTKGYVEVDILQSSEEFSYDDCLSESLPELIVDIQKRGYSPGDIAILVRKNDHGQKVAEFLLKWKNEHPEDKSVFDIVSQDGLKLSSSPAIRFCIAALRSINNPLDKISIAAMLKELVHMKLIAFDDWNNVFDAELFAQVQQRLDGLRNMTVNGMLESLIEQYGLTTLNSEFAYISELQDKVFALSQRKNLDLNSFIEWWDEKVDDLSLSMPESNKAITLMTIHKSKGLQFPVVIIPYSGWNFKRSNSTNFLWVSSDNPNFNRLPIYPVNHTNELKKSLFDEYAFEEDMQLMVDNLNLLYVAYTRAEDELYIFSPDSSKSENLSSTTKLLIDVIGSGRTGFMKNEVVSHSSGFKYSSYYLGTREEFSRTKNKSSKIESIVIHDLQVDGIKYGISQKLEATDFFDRKISEAKEKLIRGKVMHSLLSRIRVKADVDTAIEQLLNEGLITSTEVEGLKELIDGLMEKEPVRSWFSENFEIKTESSILTTDGLVYRPDRVMVQGNDAVVLDYKFGKELPSHAKQIIRYSDLIRQMGYSKVIKYLWYIDENRLLEV